MEQRRPGVLRRPRPDDDRQQHRYRPYLDDAEDQDEEGGDARGRNVEQRRVGPASRAWSMATPMTPREMLRMITAARSTKCAPRSAAMRGRRSDRASAAASRNEENRQVPDTANPSMPKPIARDLADDPSSRRSAAADRALRRSLG